MHSVSTLPEDQKYAATRQNVGFEMVDTIAEAEGISMSSVSFKPLFGKGFIGDVPVILTKPQAFVNLSGESVGAIVSYYKIPPKQVLVIFDDLDLPFAKLWLLSKGGHGGHNGHWTTSRENGSCSICSARSLNRKGKRAMIKQSIKQFQYSEFEPDAWNLQILVSLHTVGFDQF
ncbi:Peptidyl-tRNA hydrolase [Spatholobus suberectus]|nr:Peptidyl-tRNA hydrolase [Spatholobus suberectus]